MWWWKMAAAARVSALLLVYTHSVKSPRTHTRSCVQLFLPDSYKYKGCLRSLVGRSVYVSCRPGLLFQHYKASEHKSMTAGTTSREIHALSHDLEDSSCPNFLFLFFFFSRENLRHWYTSSKIKEWIGVTSFTTKSDQKEVNLEFESGVWNSVRFGL